MLRGYLEDFEHLFVLHATYLVHTRAGVESCCSLVRAIETTNAGYRVDPLYSFNLNSKLVSTIRVVPTYTVRYICFVVVICHPQHECDCLPTSSIRSADDAQINDAQRAMP